VTSSPSIDGALFEAREEVSVQGKQAVVEIGITKVLNPTFIE
jgi:hypothetical protein